MRRPTFGNLMAAISITILGGGMSACSLGDSTNWKEEVLLSDGGKMIVDRSISRQGRHAIDQRPPIGDQSLTFVLPGTAREITWKDNYSKELGSANFLPMMLGIHQGSAYLVATPMGCLSYNKWGRPNPPYVIFEYQGQEWQRIPLQELPPEFTEPNLIISTPDDEAKRVGYGVIKASMIKELNTGFKQRYFQTILREPLNTGEGVGCPDFSSHRYMSPKAPTPIKPHSQSS